MMKTKELKIMRADIDLGGCTLQAYRDDANRDVVVIVPSKSIDILTVGHNGPENFYATANAHVLVQRAGLRTAAIYFTAGKSKRCVNMFTNDGDVSVIAQNHDEQRYTRRGYDVEVKPDTPLYSHDDCERMSEYDKVYFLLTQAETR